MNENGEGQAAATPLFRRGWIGGTVILFVFITGIVLGFLPRWRSWCEVITTMNQPAIQTVSVVSLGPLIPVNGLNLPAEIRPWNEASISARADGYIKEWVADIGARVQAGQLLAEIEMPGLDQQFEQAKAQLVLAQAKLRLAETLLKTASVQAANTVELHSVQIGRNFGETVEILTGVTPSDHVISNPTDSLADGAKVRVNLLHSPSARIENY